MHALAIVLLLLALSPFLWLLVMSFKTNAEIFRWPPRLFFPATFDNYWINYWMRFGTPISSDSAVETTLTTRLLAKELRNSEVHSAA